ncbi:MAG: hypothetical protein MH825_11000 [Cyanobacteria bacterium]|nr:hypothetical protein [Cyanobacteriota bacterium]
MEPLQEQVFILNRKLDTLHQAIETLKEHLSGNSADSGLDGSVNGRLSKAMAQVQHRSRSLDERIIGDSSGDYKDILIDDNYSESSHQNFEKELTPEIQIQRLMAQLTAAYNRIADLEEQLLSRRIQ